jgi:hypothetical protein
LVGLQLIAFLFFSLCNVIVIEKLKDSSTSHKVLNAQIFSPNDEFGQLQEMARNMQH